ncbi:MAG: hypothetical protein PHU49_06630 [Syntrophorhabdaceae bacterium]|jgi:hypothetical protein|nr:hypothetical protein [Syntrophorhabdaceae bacterium]
MAHWVNGEIGTRQDVRFRQQFQHLLVTGMDEGSLPRSDTAARTACQQTESYYIGEKRDCLIDVIDPHAHMMDIDTFHFDSLHRMILFILFLFYLFLVLASLTKYLFPAERDSSSHAAFSLEVLTLNTAKQLMVHSSWQHTRKS